MALGDPPNLCVCDGPPHPYDPAWCVSGRKAPYPVRTFFDAIEEPKTFDRTCGLCKKTITEPSKDSVFGTLLHLKHEHPWHWEKMIREKK